MEETWVKKFRILTFSLIASGALNIGLLAALFTSGDKGTFLSGRAALEKKEATTEKLTNLKIIQSMNKLSFRELVALLTNQEMVEDGYTKRDLALSVLSCFHHFNLEKAIGSSVMQKRLIPMESGDFVELYPALSEEQFAAIIRFAYQERWPVTTKGLFAILQKLPSPREESLDQAFCVTPEFYALQVLFQKTGAPQEASLLLKLVSEGNWDLLDRFAKEQAQLLDLSVEKRRRLLLSYLAYRSPTAAELLLKTDFAFARQKLDDRGQLDLLTLLSQRTEESERFCASLLHSPRSDTIWQKAAEKLYQFAGETPPAPFDLKAALVRFQALGQEKTPAQQKSVATSAPVRESAKGTSYRIHAVKEGESLWKIAKQYKVKTEELVRLNDMEHKTLRPGMNLKIPN